MHSRMGVWYKQIRVRISTAAADWALLSDVQMRIGNGEYVWVGQGKKAVTEAKARYKAGQGA